MGLKYYVDLSETALASGLKRGTNLGGMMAIVINDADPGCLATQLEPPVHAAKVFQRRADVVSLDVEADSHCNRCGSVQDIVHSRHMQSKIAEIALPVGHMKMAGGLLPLGGYGGVEPSLPQFDVKIRTSPRSVGHGPPPNLRKQAPQQRIVIADHDHAVKRHPVHEF